MVYKGIVHIIAEYCRQIQYGEVIVRIKIHRGQVREVEEVQPPLKKYRIEESKENFE